MTPEELKQQRKAFLKAFQGNLAEINLAENLNNDFERALKIAKAMMNENSFSERVEFSIADLMFWLDKIIISSQHLSSKLTELKYWVETNTGSVYPAAIKEDCVNE